MVVLINLTVEILSQCKSSHCTLVNYTSMELKKHIEHSSYTNNTFI